MALQLKNIKRPCDCPEPCFRYQVSGVQFPATPTSITVDGNALPLSGTATNSNELVVLLNTALIAALFVDRFYYNVISGSIEVNTDFVYSDLLGLGAATINKIEDFCPQEVQPVPFAVLGGRIEYDAQAKTAVILPTGHSDFGTLVLSNPSFLTGSGTLDTTNIPNDTMVFSANPHAGNIEFSLQVSDGVNTGTVNCVGYLDTDNGNFVMQQPLFAMSTAGLLQVAMDLDIVGTNWLTPPFEDGYSLNVGGNVPFVSPTTITVASGDSLKLGRGDTNNGWYKQLCQWVIYF